MMIMMTMTVKVMMTMMRIMIPVMMIFNTTQGELCQVGVRRTVVMEMLTMIKMTCL